MTLPPVSFPTLGWQVVDWIEAMLPHGPGDVQGEHWDLDDDFVLFLCWLYRVHPQGHPLAGRRLVQRAVLSRPKGRGKSEFAGGWVCAEALGPVRCDGFDANGDPVGVPVRYPFLRCLATEEDQAGNTYDNVAYMLQEGEVANEYSVNVGLTRTFIKEPGGGEILPSTSGDASKDGGKESGSVADETHLYVLPKLRNMYGTVARNTGKRKAAEPLMLDTTTAWQPGERSVAEQAADRYAHLPVEEAVTKYGVLYDHHQGDEPKRFGDDRSVIKALKTAYGPAAARMDFPRIVRVIRDAEDPENDLYRYWLNRPRAAASHWMSPDEIAAAIDLDFRPPDGSMIGAGFDGSLSDDHSALWGCDEAGDLFCAGIWAKPPDWPVDEPWEVDRANVTAAVDWLFETFDVVRFYGDPPWFQAEMGDWAARHSDPRRPDTLPIREWWTNRDTPMAVACGALRTALRGSTRMNPVPVFTEPQVRQGKPLGQIHFENARVRKVRIKLEDSAEEAHVVRKERPMSPLKIDSVPASALARKARDDGVSEGEFVKKVYDRAQW